MTAVCCFSVEEIAEAQAALDLHPSSSPFWDSPSGQEALEIAVAFDLQATTSESWRLRECARLMALSAQEDLS